MFFFFRFHESCFDHVRDIRFALSSPNPLRTACQITLRDPFAACRFDDLQDFLLVPLCWRFCNIAKNRVQEVLDASLRDPDGNICDLLRHDGGSDIHACGDNERDSPRILESLSPKIVRRVAFTA